MNDKYLICSQDFCNTVVNRVATGFQVKVKIPYYRGVYVSLIDSIQLKVDDENFTSNQMTFSIGKHVLTMDQVYQASDIRWPFDQPATLTIKKPGGLAMGIHTVQFGIVIRKSYWPKTDPENLYAFISAAASSPLWSESAVKKMTLVQ